MVVNLTSFGWFVSHCVSLTDPQGASSPTKLRDRHRTLRPHRDTTSLLIVLPCGTNPVRGDYHFDIADRVLGLVLQSQPRRGTGREVAYGAGMDGRGQLPF